MELKEIERELLLKGAAKNRKFIPTNSNIVEHHEMSKGEAQLLHELATKLFEEYKCVIIEDSIIFSPSIRVIKGRLEVRGIDVRTAIY